MPSGGPSGNTTTTTNNTPWGPAQGNIEQALGAAGNLYSNNPLGPSYYPGQTYAGLNGTENGAINGLNYWGANGNSALNGSINAIGNIENSSNDPNSNPYLQSAENSTVANTLAPIQGGLAAGGRADSGLGAAATANGLGTALGNLNYGQYNTDVQQKEQAAMLAPGLFQAQLGGLQTALGAGEAQQTNSQNEIQANMNRYNFNQMRPYNALNMYDQELQGSGALGFGTQTTQQPYFSNTFANIGSGLSGLGALGMGAAMLF